MPSTVSAECAEMLDELAAPASDAPTSIPSAVVSKCETGSWRRRAAVCKTARMLRSLLRDKLYTLINIAGLSLAIASCLVLGLYLRTELTYDRYHANADRVYRVEQEFKADGRSQRVAMVSGLLGPMLAEEFADVRAYVRFLQPGLQLGATTERAISHGNDTFPWSDVYLADPNVFDVFSHKILYGDPKTALVDPSSAAVSRRFARKYFGEANPVGETITLDHGEPRTITLVFDDQPPNTHLKYDVLFSYNAAPPPPQDETERARDLFAGDNFTYLVLPEHYDAHRFAAAAAAFYERHMAARAREIHSEGWSAWLRPLADIHLYSDVEWDRPLGNRYYLYGLEAAAVFLLLIACINHVNLATAAAGRRAREIGTRKILGATRRALTLRFVGESLALAIVALIVALVVVELVVPRTPIADWLGTAASLRPTAEPLVLAASFGFVLLVGIAAGLYPAFYLAAIPPLTALKQGDKLGGSRIRLRELLVLVQFTVTACVIACTLLMAAQMRYIANRPLGFKDTGKVVVKLRGVDTIERLPTIESELIADKRIRAATSSMAMPGMEITSSYMDVETNDGTMKGVLVNHLPIQENFIDTLDIRVVAGRNFSSDVATDLRGAMIVNETLARQMGWTNPLGKRMGLRGRTVIGVVRDFNYKSLHAPVEPLVMYESVVNYSGLPPEQRELQLRYLVLDVAARDLTDTLAFVERTLRKFDAEHPFEYRFLDETLGRQYSAEQHLMKLIGVFSAICVLVACLGLFGLATFTTARRTKEIGIRKVLGASTSQIVALLSARTVLLVALGSVLASALAYAAMARWLEAFAYRVDLGPAPFVLAGAISLAVALGTVALQSLGAARMRPVQSLRQD
jgi:putative ABC transport system permease protein